MNHANATVYIILAFLLIFLPLLAFSDTVVYTEYIQFTFNGIVIDLYIVDGYEDLPETCGSKGACAYYGYMDGEKMNIIFINKLYAGQKDAWGYSVLYHEIKHIECQCDFHEFWRVI